MRGEALARDVEREANPVAAVVDGVMQQRGQLVAATLCWAASCASSACAPSSVRR
jgi:hypothetical protein